MTSLRLIKRHMKINKFAICLLIICQVISMLALTFLYSYVCVKYEHNKMLNEDRRKITIIMNQNINRNVVVSDIMQLYTTYGSNIINISLYSFYNEIPVKIDVISQSSNADKVSIGRFFYEEEKEYGVIINPLLDKSFYVCKVNDYIDINGIQHKIIGIFESPYIQVSQQSIECFQDITEIEITINRDVNDDDLHSIVEKINGFFQYGQLNYKEYDVLPLYYIGVYELILICTILGVSYINFAAFYLYVLDEDVDLLFVFAITGCNKRKIFNLLLGEVLTFLGIVYIIHIALFQFVFSKVLSIMNNGFIFDLSYSQSVLLFCIYLLGGVLMYTQLLKQYLKKSQLEVGNE